jgi:hypothetical protein
VAAEEEEAADMEVDEGSDGNGEEEEGSDDDGEELDSMTKTVPPGFAPSPRYRRMWNHPTLDEIVMDKDDSTLSDKDDKDDATSLEEDEEEGGETDDGRGNGVDQ